MSGTLILTGAIRPSWRGIVRKAPYTRLVDYLCGIRRWLEIETLDHVIYCDASGCRIPEKLFGSEKFESLTMDASEQAGRFEAGRAELESIQFILRHSRKKIESFYKCTGRLFVENFTELQMKIIAAPNAELFLRKWYGNHWADTRFFYIKAKTFQRLVEPRIRELTGQAYGGHVVESLFYEFLQTAWRLPQPVFLGHNGHTGSIYDGTYTDEEVRAAMRMLSLYGLEYFGIRQ